MRAFVRQIGLRLKLAVWTGGVVALVILGLTFQSLSREAVVAQQEALSRARVLLGSMAPIVKQAWGRGDAGPTLVDLQRRLASEFEVRSMALVDADENLVAYAGLPPAPEEIRRAVRLQMPLHPRGVVQLAHAPVELAVASPVLDGDTLSGHLMAVLRTWRPEERLRSLLVSALVNAAVWMMVGATLTFWIARRLTEPLSHLAHELESLGSSRYRISEGGRADGEIGLVQDSLLRLSESLDRERRQVEALSEQLSHQITVVTAGAQRTAAKMAAILDSTRDGFLLLNEDGWVSDANRAAREFFGHGVEGSCLWEVAEGEALQRAVREATATGKPAATRVTVPRADEHGEHWYLRVRIAPYVSGTVSKGDELVMVAEDVSESRQLQEQMFRSERLASVATLSAGVAHQLGNHLNAIKGLAGLVRRQLGKGDPDELKNDLGSIEDTVRQAADLLEKLLLVGRTRPPAHVPFAVSDVVNQALDLVEPMARGCGVDVRREVADLGCVMEGDPQLLLQAFLNIFVNGIQAMKNHVAGSRPGLGSGHGDAGGQLIVSNTCSSRRCTVRVRDTGPGIPREVARSIFDPFFTTKPEGEGTGLGLPIAARIVELHGGTIRAEGGVEQGAVFELTLPRVRLDSDEPTVEES